MKPDNQNISEAYSRVKHDQVLEEWGKPSNRIGQFAKGFMTGKSGIPGSGLVGGIMKTLAPNTANRMQGNWEHGQETNRMWDMFNNQVLASTPTPTGQQVQGWFLKQKFSKENSVVDSLDLTKLYSEPELQPIFKAATQEQKLIWAGAQDAGGSQHGGGDQQEYAVAISQLTYEQRLEFIQIILNQKLIIVNELTSTNTLAAPAAPAAPVATAAAPAAPKAAAKNTPAQKGAETKVIPPSP
jgi:hypothetical protein